MICDIVICDMFPLFTVPSLLVIVKRKPETIGTSTRTCTLYYIGLTGNRFDYTNLGLVLQLGLLVVVLINMVVRQATSNKQQSTRTAKATTNTALILSSHKIDFSNSNSLFRSSLLAVNPVPSSTFQSSALSFGCLF